MRSMRKSKCVVNRFTERIRIFVQLVSFADKHIIMMMFCLSLFSLLALKFIEIFKFYIHSLLFLLNLLFHKHSFLYPAFFQIFSTIVTRLCKALFFCILIYLYNPFLAFLFPFRLVRRHLYFSLQRTPQFKLFLKCHPSRLMTFIRPDR